MEPAEYDNIARLESTHWWYRGMAAISLSLLASRAGAASTPLHILDAGCGPSGMLTQLARFGQPIGIDLHPRALLYAQGRAPLAQASLQHLPFEQSSFDLITCLDVIYHRAVGDDAQAVSELARVLKPGGRLLIRVPALEALRGPHDEVVHTRHRYSRGELQILLRRAGLVIERLTYANTILSPLVFVARRLARNAPASDIRLPSPAINTLLETILRLESKLLQVVSFPFGVSLLALARRPNTA